MLISFIKGGVSLSRKKEVKINLDMQEGEKFQGATKRQWLMPVRITWKKGAVQSVIRQNTQIWTIKNPLEYQLESEKTFIAFRELAECIETPGLIAGPTRSGGSLEIGWLQELSAPVNERDFENVQRWVERYGLPEYNADLSMNSGDVLVIAHLAAVAYRLFEYGRRHKDRWRIKKLSKPFSLDPQSSIVFFGRDVTQMPTISGEPPEPGQVDFPPALGIALNIPSEQINSLTKESWRRIAWLWISHICDSLIKIELQTEFTKVGVLRPVLRPVGLLAWLWLHFLSYIGEADMPTQAIKTCKMCGASYSGSRSPYCPRCLPEVKNSVKYRSKKRKESVLNLKLEGKTPEEIVTKTGLTSEQVVRWFNSKDKEAQS
jgi:hypothetical protein